MHIFLIFHHNIWDVALTLKMVKAPKHFLGLLLKYFAELLVYSSFVRISFAKEISPFQSDSQVVD